ncbi:hypothetical protein HBI82_124360 [Parastagonospora nodorum]|nr:hypothetical protein HBI74_120510 [Parastagonospora nodorum]KAH5258128.1 hypothetical protein HBI71_118910 [Parastagonospora nodorum]KAH5304441.1 hypothetical protein HBI50_189130 [Parastagonospora nodorum]KAH5383094.1 hypothetical protein HBI33_120810 [Parastagonospora nodorum]KAH5469945.1 hypothetical protein HBI28_168970 [Parastagonospora nodorum]
MSTSNSSIQWPHVPGDKRPFFGPDLVLQPPTPWADPWEQNDTNSRKRRRDEDEQAITPPQIEPEPVFKHPHLTYASYLAEQSQLARKIRVTPTLLANQNSQHFRISEIGDHFTLWLSENLRWLWEEYVVRGVHWRRAKDTVSTKGGAGHCKHIDAAQRVKLIWLKQDAQRRALPESDNDEDGDNDDYPSESGGNSHNGSFNPHDDSGNGSSNDSDSNHYNAPPAQMPVPQVLPPHLIPRAVPRPGRSTRRSTGPPGERPVGRPSTYLGEPTQTSNAFAGAIRKGRFPMSSAQSSTSTSTHIVGKHSGSNPTQIAVQEVPVGQPAPSAPSAQPVDGYSASSSQTATGPTASETPAIETARPVIGVETSSDAGSETGSESSINEPDPEPSSWRNVFGNPGLWLNPRPAQNTGLGNSMLAKKKPTTSTAQSNPADTPTTRVAEDGANGIGEFLPVRMETTQAAKTAAWTGSTHPPQTEPPQTEPRRSARLEQLQQARTEASQPAAQTDPSQPPTQTEAMRPTESQQPLSAQLQSPSNQQNAIVPQPLPGYFPCPRCTYHNAVTDTWCTSCGALFSNFTGIAGPA